MKNSNIHSKAILTITLTFFALFSIAQKTGKFNTVEIKTSAQCEMCKERIEEKLTFEKGVKKAELSLNTKIVKVTYKTSKTDENKLKSAIAAVGYDADDVEANKEAYAKLPACCKKPDDPEHIKH